jgi:hypothetical protein
MPISGMKKYVGKFVRMKRCCCAWPDRGRRAALLS